jgi:hypothetical protein
MADKIMSMVAPAAAIARKTDMSIIGNSRSRAGRAGFGISTPARYSAEDQSATPFVDLAGTVVKTVCHLTGGT